MTLPWRIAFLCTLVLGSAWIWIGRIDPTGVAARTPQPVVGFPAPDFALPVVQASSGEDVWRLSEQQGRPLILNFWATWCGPCRAEMPMLQQIATDYAEDVLIVGIDQGESQAVVDAFLDEFGIEFPILLDITMEIGNRYNILGLPTTFFIDSQGVIQQIYAGELNGAILVEGIGKIAP